MPLPAASASDPNKQFQQKMREIEFKRLEERAKQQALSLGLPYVKLIGLAIPTEVLSMIPEAQARLLSVIPFLHQAEKLSVATTSEPTTEHKALADELQKKHFLTVEWNLTSQNSFDHAIALYATVPHVVDTPEGVEVNPKDIEQFAQLSKLGEIADKLKTLSITEMLNLVIAGALNTKSSDVHIEAEELGVKIRYRIDGVLTDIATLERETWSQLVSRIKLLSRMKINVSNHPQDGRFRIELPATSGGKVRAEECRKIRSASEESAVGSGLISMSSAP